MATLFSFHNPANSRRKNYLLSTIAHGAFGVLCLLIATWILMYYGRKPDHTEHIPSESCLIAIVILFGFPGGVASYVLPKLVSAILTDYGYDPASTTGAICCYLARYGPSACASFLVNLWSSMRAKYYSCADCLQDSHGSLSMAPREGYLWVVWLLAVYAIGGCWYCFMPRVTPVKTTTVYVEQ